MLMFLYFILFFIHIVVSKTDYCNIKCFDYRKIHTVCLRSGCSLGLNCGQNVQFTDLEDGEKDRLLKVHNELRAKVAKGQLENQPAAEHMPDLKWHEEVAFVANCWAKLCEFRHDDGCRDVDGEQVGQNIGMIMPYKGIDSLIQIVNLWFSEHQQYTFSKIGSIQNTGHYTQLIWANTTYLGCSKVVFNSRVHLVCNYMPAGNVYNRFPYNMQITSNAINVCGLKSHNFVDNYIFLLISYIIIYILYQLNNEL